MSEGLNFKQLEAIELSDHMTMTPPGHDPDGWFRYTIRQLIIELCQFRLAAEPLVEEGDEPAAIDKNGNMLIAADLIERLHRVLYPMKYVEPPAPVSKEGEDK